MTDGVLDERLQQEVRHLRIQDPRVDVELHAQPIAEPGALDLD